LALIGGDEWQEGCDFDAGLLEAAGTKDVLVLPTAAAYEGPSRVVDAARGWFNSLGASVTALNVLQRRDAEDKENIAIVGDARFIYLSDGSPLHLRSVLKGSLLWEAIVSAWQNGAVVAGSSAGAMVLGDPMVDPRGGAFTLGLGLVEKLAVVPHRERWTGDKARRMTQLMPKGIVVAEIEERTALIRRSESDWGAEGPGAVTLTLDHEILEPSALSR